MGGCSSSKHQASAPTGAGASQPGQAVAGQTLLTGTDDRKQQVDELVAAVRGTQLPHHVDTSIMMIPYFRIQPKNLQLWKEHCDKFYEAAKKEDGLLFYGFAYSEAEGKGEVKIREGYKDAASLIAHIRAVDVPLQAALKLSQVERVELHGLASELQKVKGALTGFAGVAFEFFDKEPQSLIRPTPHSGEHGSDTQVSVAQYYKVPEEKANVVKEHGQVLAKHSATVPGLEHHALSISAGGLALLHHSFADAEAAVEHLKVTHPHRNAGLEKHATLENLEIQAPPTELAKIKSFIARTESQAGRTAQGAAHAVAGAAKEAEQGAAGAAQATGQAAQEVALRLKNATLYVLDGRAIRRTFSGVAAKVETAGASAAHSAASAVAGAEHAAAAEAHAAGAAVSGAAARAEGAVEADARAAEAAAVQAKKKAEAALEAGVQEVEAKAAAAEAAVGSAAERAKNTAVADAHAAGAAVHTGVAKTEAAAAAAASAVMGALHHAEHAAAADARAVGAAVHSGVDKTKAAAAAAESAAVHGVHRAEHAAAAEAHAVGAAVHSGVDKTKAAAVAAESAVAGAAHRAEHAAAADAHAVGAAVHSGVTKAEAGAAAAAAAVGGAVHRAEQGAEAGVHAAVAAVHPHHIDTSVTMCPYFKIKPSNLELWKSKCDAFYETAKKEDGMLSYGFCYSEEVGKGEVHIRETFGSGASLVAHIRAIDVPLQAALKLSQLERVEVHGPAQELEKIRKEMTRLGDVELEFFEQEPEALRRATPHTGEHGSDKMVSVSHCLETPGDTSTPCKELLKPAADGLQKKAKEDAGLERHAFSYAGGKAQLHQEYANADAAIAGLSGSVQYHTEITQVTVVKRVEIRGPLGELEKLKAFAAQGAGAQGSGGAPAAKMLQGASLYSLDARAIRRPYSGTAVVTQTTTTTVTTTSQSVAVLDPVMDSSYAPRPQTTSSWWPFSACGC